MTPSIAPFSRNFRRRGWLIAAMLLVGGLTMAWLFSTVSSNHGNAAEARPSSNPEDHFNGQRAYESLKQLCAIGPRPSGSPGMAEQQKLLAAHFQELGGQVEFQRFRVPHPRDGSSAPMVNILVRWHPESTTRILLCAHYDTLPYPMLDRVNPRGTFVGANDNASGVAILMELAHDIPAIKSKYGIDFLLLDGEEFRFSQQDPFFLGSGYFAREYAEYVKNKPAYRYRWGVLLDMVGDADLRIGQEGHGVQWKDTRPLVEEIWATAARLGVRDFVSKKLHDVDDDHVILHNIGGIPCIDVIDFDYPAWHTQADTPEQCSPRSLAKVGWVLKEWLATAR